MKKTISGWIARDDKHISGSNRVFLYKEKPVNLGGFYNSEPNDRGLPLPPNLYKKVTFANSPQRCKITIEVVEEDDEAN